MCDVTRNSLTSLGSSFASLIKYRNTPLPDAVEDMKSLVLAESRIVDVAQAQAPPSRRSSPKDSLLHKAPH